MVRALARVVKKGDAEAINLIVHIIVDLEDPTNSNIVNNNKKDNNNNNNSNINYDNGKSSVRNNIDNNNNNNNNNSNKHVGNALEPPQRDPGDDVRQTVRSSALDALKVCAYTYIHIHTYIYTYTHACMHAYIQIQ